MKLKQGVEQEYGEYVEKNSDPYGKATVEYSERWADRMEAHLAEGTDLEDIAKEASHEANIEGISAFMYGCAVSGLAYFWIHGERLRLWHNLDSQIGSEGERANESGTVLNPALLNIG